MTAIVAGEPGALVDHLKSFGGEWLPFTNATWSPPRLRRNAEALDTFIAQERVDIVHAKSPGAAWSALIATDRNSAWLVTDLPDLTPRRAWLSSLYLGSLARGDRVIARSMWRAVPSAAKPFAKSEPSSGSGVSIQATFGRSASGRPIQRSRPSGSPRAWRKYAPGRHVLNSEVPQTYP